MINLLDHLTYYNYKYSVICSFPCRFEGNRRKEKAEFIYKIIKAHTIPRVVKSTDIQKKYGNQAIAEHFAMIDKSMLEYAFRLIS